MTDLLYRLRKKIISFIPPHLLRQAIYGRKWKALGVKILIDYEGKEGDKEIQEALSFIKQYGPDYIPYFFSKKYKRNDIQVTYDKACGLRYVMYKGKKLYFKKRWNALKIKDSFHQLLIEQDQESPHRYLDENFALPPNAVVADIGAAEGIFILEYIEQIEKAYLFECDPEWLEPLKNTFKPWQDKIEIIPKMVTNKNNQHCISLDQLTTEKPITFYKIDVDGGEDNLLKGAENTFCTNRDMQVAICTYHAQYDFNKLSSYFGDNGFALNSTPNYMLFFEDQNLQYPYFRKGVLRCINKSS